MTDVAATTSPSLNQAATQWTKQSTISIGLAVLILGGVGMAGLELRGTWAQLTGLTHDVAALRGSMTAVQTSMATMQQRLADNTAKLSALQTDIANIKADLREQRKK